MFQVSVHTTDPKTGAELPVPRSTRDRVDRASVILGDELAMLTERFTIAADWQFIRMPDDSIGVMLALSDREGVGARVERGPFSANQFTDDDSIRRTLRPILLAIGTSLSDLTYSRIGVLLREIRRDLELYASLPEG